MKASNGTPEQVRKPQLRQMLGIFKQGSDDPALSLTLRLHCALFSLAVSAPLASFSFL